MIEVPVWVIPTSIVFLITIGGAIQRFRQAHITPKQLDKKLEPILSERKEIWDLVRETQGHVKVILLDMDWLKKSVDEIKDKMGRNGNGKL